MRGRRPTADEVRLWRAAMGDDDPAGAGAGGAAEAPASPAQRTVVPAHAQRGQSQRAQPQRPRPNGPAPAPAALDRHAARAIRRRRLVPEDRLDLHGMTQTAAHAALHRFLREAHARGLRCVAVITGKGVRVSDSGTDADPFTRRETGVLRRALPLWLDNPELAALVIGSEPAPPRDGGDGARYVLLRRKGRS